MGLQNTAHYLKTKGRGGDTELVHMSKDEVKALQAVALSHGGSLSINPDTGLPEALSLKKILPTVVGAGLAATGVGMPIAIAAGFGTGLATSGGNLTQGILGGLGAWGGASLVGGLMGTGAALGGAEAAGALGQAAAAEGATTAGMASAANTGLPVGTETLGGTVTSGGIGGGSAVGAAQPSSWDTLVKGYKATPFDMNYLKQNMFPIGAAAAPVLLGGDDQVGNLPATQGGTGQIRPYTYSQTRNPNYGMPGEPYFTQSYTAGQPYNAKEGGIVGLASGGQPSGPVERMSMMDQKPGMYPQGMIASAKYATPSQVPASMEVIKSDYDVGVNPMTGLQDRNMARGGIVALADGGLPPVEQLQVAPNLGRYSNQPTPAQNPAVAAYNQILADRAANEYVVQAPPTNLLPGGGERASAADTSKLINEMYLKNLGRQAEQEGLDYWTGQKMSGAMSLADVNKGISTSGEANIRNWYKENYGRYATPEEIASVQQQYASGVDPKTIMAELQKGTAGYQKYMNAPITKANFDAAAYLAANPDIKRISEYGADPFLHYERHGKAEGREAPRLAYQPPSAAPKSTTGAGQTGYKYDPVTQTFTAPPAPQPQDAGGFFANISQDPNFQNYLQQQYMQYQQAQQGGGGKAGGLMPGSLKYAKGGIADLGGYSDGGRMLKGPGDGMSDSIPGVIGGRQPARLADGEFVVPADVVSHLGNGSTDAGARKLYKMMDKIRKARTGKKKQAPAVKAERFMPA